MQAGTKNLVCIPVGSDFKTHRKVLVATGQTGCFKPFAIIVKGARDAVQHGTGNLVGKLVTH